MLDFYFRIKYRVKTLYCVYLFLLRYRWQYLAAIGGVVAGLSVLIIPTVVWAGVVSAISVVLGACVLIKDMIALSRSNHDLLIEKEPNSEALEKFELSQLYEGYELLRFRGQAALYCREINKALDSTSCELNELDSKFRLSDTAKKIAPKILFTRAKDKTLYNDPKLRLVADLNVNILATGSPIDVQKTDYYSGVCTNEMTNTKVLARTGSIVYDGMSFVVHDNNVLRDLRDSLCSNHVGVDAIAFTNDGYLFALLQSSKAAVHSNQLVASGSGSADYADYQRSDHSLRGFVITAMERELLEEDGLTGLSRDDLRTRIIGYARHLNRGGKPQFFGISALNVGLDKIKQTASEREFIERIHAVKIKGGGVNGLAETIEGFINGPHRGAFSMTLYLNLLFLQQYLETSPNELWHFLYPSGEGAINVLAT